MEFQSVVQSMSFLQKQVTNFLNQYKRIQGKECKDRSQSLVKLSNQSRYQQTVVDLRNRAKGNFEAQSLNP